MNTQNYFEEELAFFKKAQYYKEKIGTTDDVRCLMLAKLSLKMNESCESLWFEHKSIEKVLEFLEKLCSIVNIKSPSQK